MKKIAMILVSSLLAGCVSPKYCSGGDVNALSCGAAVTADVVLVPLAVAGVVLAGAAKAEADAEEAREEAGDVTCNSYTDFMGNVQTKCVRGNY